MLKCKEIEGENYKKPMPASLCATREDKKIPTFNLQLYLSKYEILKCLKINPDHRARVWEEVVVAWWKKG